MFLRLSKRRAQSALEYVILLVVIIGALIIMQVYIKRSVQGKLKESADEIGTQFDPGHMSEYNYTTLGTATTREQTMLTGQTRQATEDRTGTEVPQESIRYGATTTEALGNTSWGAPTN